MLPARDIGLLVVAGVLAGVVGSAGAITSLISYPALLAVGIPALPANVSNSVAFLACWSGSALGSRPELRGQGRWLRSWALLIAVGSALGAALLLLTPPGAFSRIVPFLVAAASVSLLLQPRVSAWRAMRGRGYDHVLLAGGLFAVSVHSGYFGAGAGVMVLAVLLLTMNEDFPRTNALKNMALGIADLVAAAGFVAFGPVHWAATASLAVGLLAGSTIGPVLPRRLPIGAIRTIAALAGFALAIHLWINPT